MIFLSLFVEFVFPRGQLTFTWQVGCPLGMFLVLEFSPNVWVSISQTFCSSSGNLSYGCGADMLRDTFGKFGEKYLIVLLPMTVKLADLVDLVWFLWIFNFGLICINFDFPLPTTMGVCLCQDLLHSLRCVMPRRRSRLWIRLNLTAALFALYNESNYLSYA